MTEAEKLHQRKMQLKNEVVRPLLVLMDSGLDVPSMLENMAKNASEGKSLDGNKVGEEWERTET